jgi:hypothetical protein
MDEYAYLIAAVPLNCVRKCWRPRDCVQWLLGGALRFASPTTLPIPRTCQLPTSSLLNVFAPTHDDRISCNTCGSSPTSLS